MSLESQTQPQWVWKVQPSVYSEGEEKQIFTTIRNVYRGWAWWLTLIIPEPWRLRQKDYEFETSLSYIVRLCLKNKTKQKTQKCLPAEYNND
jgi:hypothetical protein